MNKGLNSTRKSAKSDDPVERAAYLEYRRKKNQETKNKDKNRQTGAILRQKRREAGVCQMCGKPAVNNLSVCEKHWFVNTAYRSFRKSSVEDAMYLKELWLSQNKSCMYCDRELILGENMEIDHKLPKSRFEDVVVYQKDNVQFLCHQCNVTKNDMTDSEFITFCKKVAEKYK